MDSIWHRTSKQSTLDSVKRGHLHSARVFQGAVSTYKVIEILMNIQLLYALIVKNSRYYNDSLNILDLIYTKCERQVLKVVRVSQ